MKSLALVACGLIVAVVAVVSDVPVVVCHGAPPLRSPDQDWEGTGHSVYSSSPVNVVAVPADDAVTHSANWPEMGRLISKPGVFHSPQLLPAVNGSGSDHHDVVAVRPVIAAAAVPPADDTAVTSDALAIPDSCSGVTAFPPAFVPVTVLMLNTTEAFAGNAAAPSTPHRTAEMLMSEFAELLTNRIGVVVVVVTVAPAASHVAVSKTPILYALPSAIAQPFRSLSSCARPDVAAS